MDQKIVDMIHESDDHFKKSLAIKNEIMKLINSSEISNDELNDYLNEAEHGFVRLALVKNMLERGYLVGEIK